MTTLRLLLLACAADFLAPHALAQPPNDYAAELPRIAPKSPAEALKTFRLRPGFRIELVASEPLIQSPVALDFDENGRMFVVEYPEYNQYANPNFKGHGRIRLLEDTDGDGKYDRATTYVDNLHTPVAVACYDGGVFVGVPPDILFCKDTDGDGKADIRKPIFTGFGRDHAGEGMLNSFRWGMDCRFHVATSGAGGEVRRADQKDAKAVSIRRGVFRFDPRSLAFEVASGGAQHGLTLDDWGHAFVCDNSNPILQIMYDARYLAQNPYVQAPPAAVDITPAGKFTKLFRVSSVEPWRVLRTRLRSQGVVPGSDEGGQPSGFFTAATGVTAYRGNAFPEEYRGNLFVGEVSGNLVYRARLEPKGVGFEAVRAEADAEFLASTDNWFRPVQFANAPDGTLYVIDMYRELIEGAAFLPPQILKHLDVSSGIDRGRIYRIVPEGFKQPKAPKLGQATTAELIALLEHPNGWHRDTATRLLFQRQDKAAVAPLKKMALESRSPLARALALHSLRAQDALAGEFTVRALDDKDARVRAQAVRLLEGVYPPVHAERLLKLTEDPDVRVRYQLAFSLGVPLEPAAPGGKGIAQALDRLAVRDGADAWFRVAILTSATDCAGELFGLLMKNNEFRDTEPGGALLTALAGQIGAAGKAGDIAAVTQGIETLAEADKPLAQTIVRQLASQPSAAVRERLTGPKAGKAGAILAGLLADARKIAADRKRSAAARAAALRTLGLAPFSEVRGLFAEALQLRQPQPVQQAALETLGRYDDPAVPELLLAAWPGLGPQLRATATESLFSRPAWINAFLDAVEHGTVKPGDLDPARVALLQASANAQIRNRGAKLFASSRLGKRQDVIAAYQKALQFKGDPAKGKAVFKKECSACHRLDGVGEQIGADLSAVRDRGLDAVLLNILDPNREVKPQYLSYYLVTDTGRTITGMISAETANSLTIRRADGTNETILRVHIEELRSTGLSFMPEGLEKQIDVPAMADLLAYLNSIK